MMACVAPPLTEGELLVRHHFTFEKRRKELDKRKKKEAKRQARLEKKTQLAEAEAAGEVIDKGPDIAQVDQFGIPIETDDVEDEPAD